MKKGKKIIALLAISMLLLTGCTMKMEYGMDIHSDKSMDFNVIVGMDDELLNAAISSANGGDGTETYTEEEQWDYLENSMQNDSSEENPADYGFQASRYEEDGLKGIKYSKKINNIDEITGSEADFTLDEFAKVSDKVVFTKNGNVYRLNIEYNDTEETEELESMNVGMIAQYKVTLPKKPISHNATEVSEDGKTLTWNLLSTSTNNIELEFDLENKNYTMLIAGVTLLIVLIVIVLLITKNKKKQKNNSKPAMTTSTNSPTNINPVNPIGNTNNVNPTVNQSINDSNVVNNNTASPVENTGSMNIFGDTNSINPVDNTTNMNSLNPTVNQSVNDSNVADNNTVSPVENTGNMNIFGDTNSINSVDNTTNMNSLNPTVNQSINNSNITDNNTVSPVENTGNMNIFGDTNSINSVQSVNENMNHVQFDENLNNVNLDDRKES